MKLLITILFLGIVSLTYSQTRESNCIYPSIEILPLELRSCQNLTSYFKDCHVLQKDLIENKFVSISCKLFSNGNIRDFKAGYINSINTIPNPELVKLIEDIRNWNLSELLDYEYYGLRFKFSLTEISKELRINLSWELKNYFDFKNNSVNKIDDSGLKQGQWVDFTIDTSINHWVVILTEIDSGHLNQNNIRTDTVIYKRINSIGFFENNQRDSIWYIYDHEIQGYRSKEDTIRFGTLRYIANFEKGHLNGILKTFYSSGILKTEIEYKNGKPEGNIKCFYENGQLKFDGIIDSNNEFFNGTEYSINRYKLKDRKFNYRLFVNEWADLTDLYLLIDKQ